jgi:Flp pilus assembly pilin Flp
VNQLLKHFCSLQIALMNLRDREEGQTMAEYALVLALIAAVTAAVFTGLGGAVKTKLTEITSIVTGGGGGTPAPPG